MTTAAAGPSRVVPYASPRAKATASPDAPRFGPALSLGLLIACVLIGLGARIGAAIHLHAWAQPRAMEHKPLATSLVTEGVFAYGMFGYYGPSSIQSPTYPFILAMFFKLFGTDTARAYQAAIFFNGALGALSVLLTYLMCRSLKLGRAVALLAAGLVAVWPTQVYSATVAQAICLIVCCVVATIWLFHRAVDTGRVAPWVAFGVIGCITAMTEPVLLPFMAFSGILILFWRTLPIAIRIRNAVLLLLCAFCCFAPWTLRNYMVHGVLMPSFKSGVNLNLWKTNNDYASGTDRPVIADEEKQRRAELDAAELRSNSIDLDRMFGRLTLEQRAALYGKTEVEREALFGQWVKEWRDKNPGRVWQLNWTRFVKTVWYEADNPQAASTIYIATRTALLIFTPIGLILCIVLKRRWLVPAMIVCTAIGVHTLTIAAARFIFPHEPWQIAMLSLPIVAAAWKVGLVRRADVLEDDASLSPYPGRGPG
jgi:hypothetical protein